MAALLLGVFTVRFALLCGINILPPQFSLGVPAEARACEQFFFGLRVAGGNDAGPSVLSRDLLVSYAFQRWEIFKVCWSSI